jgi:hypothetical protein
LPIDPFFRNHSKTPASRDDIYIEEDYLEEEAEEGDSCLKLVIFFPIFRLWRIE